MDLTKDNEIELGMSAQFVFQDRPRIVQIERLSKMLLERFPFAMTRILHAGSSR